MDFYWADIAFAYHADGVDYYGERISIGYAKSSSKGRHKKWIRKYPEGKKATVFTNPKDPEMSLLEKCLNTAVPWVFICSFLFLAAGILMHFK